MPFCLLENSLIHLFFFVQTNDPVNDKGVLDRKIGHKQKTLLKDVNFELSNEEEDLLLRLETFVMWAGRYPMPRTFEKLGPQLLSGGIKLPPFFTIFNADEAQISQLIDRSEEALSSSKSLKGQH